MSSSQHQDPSKVEVQEAKPAIDDQELQEKPQSEDKDKEKDSKAKLPRDIITGRTLVEDGESCLRCIEKGLRCTLNFVGVEGVAKCAACKRSNTQHCLRQRAPWKRISFVGPPWKNPNYFAVGDHLNPADMEEMLQEHFLGQQTYRHGTYSHEADRKQMALPPFNGTDLPIGERPENWKTMDWKRALPIPENKSLHPRPIKASGPYVNEDSMNYLCSVRRYPRRDMHLREYLRDLDETH
ncbi:hypothetical protein F4819DRAFT_347706 [Hypoxylon fuscum]|nr:hypothetical protein F4819DRAFT_347706 [Hypoxylon fuscum]